MRSQVRRHLLGVVALKFTKRDNKRFVIATDIVLDAGFRYAYLSLGGDNYRGKGKHKHVICIHVLKLSLKFPPENSPHSFLIKFLIKQKGMYYYIPILTYIVVDYSPNSPIFTTFSMFVTPFPRWLAGPPPVKTKMSPFSASPASNTISVASSNRSFVVSAL